MDVDVRLWILHLWYLCFTVDGFDTTKDVCPSEEWSINIPEKSCIKFHPYPLDYVSAEELCRKEGSDIPYTGVEINVTLAFQRLPLEFINSTFQFWTMTERKHTSAHDKQLKRDSGNQTDCMVIQFRQERNFSHQSMECSDMSTVLCEYKIPDANNIKDIWSLETRDFVAIGAGVTIAVVFCIVVVMDIVKHIRTPNKVMKSKIHV